MTTHADETLLGADFAAVHARYGAPLGCEHDRGVLRLTYLGDDGNAVAGAIELADGVAVAVADGIRPSPRGTDGDRFVGEPIERVLPRTGAPQRSATFGDCVRLTFADCEITTYEGIVACVVPILPSVAAPTPRASA